MTSQIDLIKTEMEAKGYELRHSWSSAFGSALMEKERVKIASKYPFGILDEGFRKEWASFKEENEQRLLTMAFAECRFRKKSIK